MLTCLNRWFHHQLMFSPHTSPLKQKQQHPKRFNFYELSNPKEHNGDNLKTNLQRSTSPQDIA